MANHIDSLNSGKVHLIAIMNFRGGGTSLDSFLNAYKTNATKEFPPYVWFGGKEKLNSEVLPPYDFLFSTLRNRNPLEEYNKNITSFLETFSKGV